VLPHGLGHVLARISTGTKQTVHVRLVRLPRLLGQGLVGVLRVHISSEVVNLNKNFTRFRTGVTIADFASDYTYS